MAFAIYAVISRFVSPKTTASFKSERGSGCDVSSVVVGMKGCRAGTVVSGMIVCKTETVSCGA